VKPYSDENYGRSDAAIGFPVKKRHWGGFQPQRNIRLLRGAAIHQKTIGRKSLSGH
jgi:hypothetical protein